jgi:DNA-binding XRE family transcriptional regulator
MRTLLDPEKLRAAMAAHDVRQVDLAAAASVTQPAISHLLSGPRNPAAIVCVRIARHLQVAVEDLLSEYDVPSDGRASSVDIDTATRYARTAGKTVEEVVIDGDVDG